ncbi:adrenodoxin-like [Platysternon megacephalum]|uniref:Adrenodoxin-like n=1 Tax=Platysternon megacephalum TaxID=55544 RepID=A0A4D9DN28_9SAUR|nr:adrenodoxin-like [Platysternon megacephalum]
MATRWGICSAGRISHDFLAFWTRFFPISEQIRRLLAQGALGEVTLISMTVGHPMEKIPRLVEKKLGGGAILDIGCYCVQFASMVLGGQRPESVLASGFLHPTAQRPLEPSPDSAPAPQAFWTRFFPISEQIRRLLAQGALGEVTLISMTVGHPMENIPRLVEKKLGGGAILDIGCYCVQFASMVLGGQRPESVLASGFLHPTGVDETTSVILNYAGKRQAVLSCTMRTELPNQAWICGTKGSIELPAPWYAPTTMLVNNQRHECPLPPPAQPLNFSNGTGMRYEAQHVRQCLLQGLPESPIMSLAESELVASIVDEVRGQLGVTFAEDQQG